MCACRTAQRLGAVGQGWKVSLTTLMNERLAVGEVHRPEVEDLVELSRSLTLSMAGRRSAMARCASASPSGMRGRRG